MSRRVSVDAGALRALVLEATLANPNPSAKLGEALARIISTTEAVDRPWLTYAEAARVLGVSERTVRRRVADGGLPARRVGRQVRIPAAAVTSGQERPGAANPGDSASVGVHGRPETGDPDAR